MDRGPGIVLIVAGSAVALAAAFTLRRRLPGAAVAAIVAVAGAAIGAGALLVQPHASPADWAVTIPIMVVLLPVHARIVFGPLRPGGGPAPGARLSG